MSDNVNSNTSTSNVNSNTNSIEELTAEVKSLRIERRALIARITALESQVESAESSKVTAVARLVPDNSSAAATIVPDNTNVTSPPTATSEVFIPPPLPYRLDSNRDRIYPGDSVSFDTPTKFHSRGHICFIYIFKWS